VSLCVVIAIFNSENTLITLKLNPLIRPYVTFRYVAGRLATQQNNIFFVDKAKQLLVTIFLARELSRYLFKNSNSTMFTSAIHHSVVIFPFHSVNHFPDFMEPHKIDLVADAALWQEW
jgi:hypothetical protein